MPYPRQLVDDSESEPLTIITGSMVAGRHGTHSQMRVYILIYKYEALRKREREGEGGRTTWEWRGHWSIKAYPQ